MSLLGGSLWLRLAVALLVLGYLVAQIDLREAAASVGSMPASTYPAILGMLAVDRAVATSRWVLLVNASGVAMPLAFGARLFLVSSFLGSFLPAGIGGDVARTLEMTRVRQGRQAVAVAAVDRGLGLGTVVLLGAIGVATWNGPLPTAVAAAVYVLLTLVLVAGVAAAFADVIVPRVVPLTVTRWSQWARVASLMDVLPEFRRRWPWVACVVVLTLALQAIRVLLAWVIGVGMGMNVPLLYYFVVMPLGILLILLPISFGGFGPAQGVVVWMLRPAGVPDATSFAMSTLYILLGLLANLAGAFLYLSRRR